MSGALSKRQQARNERALQDLIKTVPGNNVCADCQARNPGWASWSLGIFLCMRCAAIHRKLGTHITKVKSLSMDSWSNDQVENMRRVGNVTSNKTYNPENAKPPIPFDVDEADSAMERFIRQKYQNGTVGAPVRHHSGSTNSDDQPPPLPPKTGSRFGFRSASSIFPLSSKARREAEIESRQDRSPSPQERGRVNKQSKVLGQLVGSQDAESLDTKLNKLRDMGFKDEKRNVTVLRGLSGNLEKAIETLIRLGEGRGSAPVVARSGEGSRTPTSPAAGITIDRTRQKSPQRASTNPFDRLDLPPTPAQPQSSQSTGNLGQAQNQALGNSPYQPSSNSNPFNLAPSQSQYSLNQAFQHLAVSSSQPLFPNHTGGFPGPQHPQQQQLYQQSMTPPVPSVSQQYYPPIIYENSTQQAEPQNASYNPFMQQQSRPAPAINTGFQSNPYAQQLVATPQSLYQSPLTQSPQYAGAFYDNGTSQQPQQQQMNPFFNQNSAQAQNSPQNYNTQAQQQFQPQPQYQQQAQYQQYQPPSQPTVPQQTGRVDKRSILDLYNFPQMAPRPLQHNQNESQDPSGGQGQSPFSQPQRSVSSPLASHPAGSRNPFLSGVGDGGTQSPGEDLLGNMGKFPPNEQGSRHQSQESMSIDAGAWNNGRHSPDAWGTISARSLR